jgi:hypothetical protein
MQGQKTASHPLSSRPGHRTHAPQDALSIRQSFASLPKFDRFGSWGYERS